MPSKIIAGLVPKSLPRTVMGVSSSRQSFRCSWTPGEIGEFEVEYEDEVEDVVEIDRKLKWQSVNVEVSSANSRDCM
jgi:hypothetical protein